MRVNPAITSHLSSDDTMQLCPFLFSISYSLFGPNNSRERPTTTAFHQTHQAAAIEQVETGRKCQIQSIYSDNHSGPDKFLDSFHCEHNCRVSLACLNGLAGLAIISSILATWASRFPLVGRAPHVTSCPTPCCSLTRRAPCTTALRGARGRLGGPASWSRRGTPRSSWDAEYLGMR